MVQPAAHPPCETKARGSSRVPFAREQQGCGEVWWDVGLASIQVGDEETEDII